MELFWKMCSGLGAEAGWDQQSDAMMGAGTAPIIRPLLAEQAGYISTIHARDIGIAVVELGGGRKLPGAPINHRVGISEAVKVGQAVSAGDPLCLIHAESEAAFDTAASLLNNAISIGEQLPQGPLIIDTLTEVEAG